MSAALTVTRIANSCALLDFDGDVVLTDPYFTERWHLHRGEPLGMTVGELPRLSAIVVSHFFPNHWDTRGLAQFAHKAETPVFVPTDRMVKSARELGFERVTRAMWGERHPITERVLLEVVEAHRGPGGQVNNYVVKTDDVSVFFGGEARDLEPLRAYRATHDAVDIAMLPVNGLHVPVTGPQIVMNSDESVEGARSRRAHLHSDPRRLRPRSRVGLPPARRVGRGRGACLHCGGRRSGLSANRCCVEPRSLVR